MSKQEKDRTLLRAFGDAARGFRLLNPHPQTTEAWRERIVFDASRERNRRRREYYRAHAHALATAWGL